jgi:DNA-binding CsgD family transcriptional regulator
MGTETISLLNDLSSVLDAPLLGIAAAFSKSIGSLMPHAGLVIFTEDCTGSPQKKAGDMSVVGAVTIHELDVIRERSLGERVRHGVIGGQDHAIFVGVARTGTLLVLVEPAAPQNERAQDIVMSLFESVALVIRHQVAAARPDYLRDSRMASTERARVIAELTDAHSTTLERVLAILRARDIADPAARAMATEIAATAMVHLRAQTDRDRSLSEEPVSKAFERLRDDLSPLVRFGHLDVQFVEPPTDGRALPGEVAHAARAIVRGVVLTLIEQSEVARVRVQWDCDGKNLLVGIRDDGPGTLTADTSNIRRLTARVVALSGTLKVRGTPGWGSEIAVELPLDSPLAAASSMAEWSLTSRENMVLQLVVRGARNRAIADELAISENTVKFHVANLLRKLGATNRSELAALVRVE